MKKIALSFAAVLLLTFSAQAKTSGPLAKSLWDTLNLIGMLENVQMHLIDGDKDTIHIDDVSCVTESYDACAFFAYLGKDKKMIVHKDLSPKLMNVLGASDIPTDDNGQMYVHDIECTKTMDQYTCYITE